MPYGQPGQYRQKPYKRQFTSAYPRAARAGKPWGHRMMDYGIKGAKLATQLYALKKLINTEKKTFTRQLTGVTPATGTAVVESIQEIAQGTDFNERIGRSIKAVSVQLKGQITIHASATFTSARYMLVQDTENRGSAITIANLLENATAADDFFSLRSGFPAHMKRFKILCDQTVQLDQTDLPIINVECFRKLNMHIRFNGTGGTDASMGQNSIWLIMISSEATNIPTFNIQSRLRYIDN